MRRLLILPGLILVLLGTMMLLTRGGRDYLPIVATRDGFYDQMSVYDPADGSQHAITPRYGAGSQYESGRWIYYKSVLGRHTAFDLETWHTHTMPFEASFEVADASRDAEWLLVRATLGDRLYRAAPDGSALTEITPDVGYVRGAWISPADEWVVVLALNQRLYRMRPDGTELAVLDEGVLTFACWYGDEELLAWRAGSYYRVDVVSATAYSLETDDVRQCVPSLGAIMQHDGGLLDPNSGAKLWGGALESETVVVGQRVYWGHRRADGRIEVWGRDIPADTEQMVAVSPTPAQHWRLTAEAVLFVQDDDTVSVVDLARGHTGQLALVAHSQDYINRLAWSPDGEWAVYYLREGAAMRLVRQHMPSGDLESVSGDGWFVAWTRVPDHGGHRWLALALGGGLVAAGVWGRRA